MARLDNLNLSQRVTDILGPQIISGAFNDGSEFPTELSLCDEYGISRTAVREAVKMLAAKGLITSRPRQGIKVAPTEQWNLYDSDVLKWLLESSPSLEVLREFLQVRIAIEPQAAYLAALTQDSKAIAEIEAASKKMDEAAIQDDNIHQGDIDFHVAILMASGNRFFKQLKKFIQTALNVSIQFTTPAKETLSDIAIEHKKVLQAIQSGDADLAKSLMYTLNADALEFINNMISKQK